MDDDSELSLNSDYDDGDEVDEELNEYCADYGEEEEEEEMADEYENDACAEDEPSSIAENVCDADETAKNELVCETCDRDFQNMYSYQKHMNEHIVCSIDGCTFTAHEKIVAMHVKTQHSTGLYYKICHLSTPEEIKKWREERKNNYPSKENIARRQEKQAEMLKRGEKLTTLSKFKKKDRFKLRALKKKNKNTKSAKKPPSTFRVNKSLIDVKREWNGQMFPFRGTGDLYKTEEVVNDTFEDTEWEDNYRQDIHKEVVINKSLGALMSAYNSDDSDEEKIPTTKVISKSKSQSAKVCDTIGKTSGDTTEKTSSDTIEKTSSDNEAPMEEKISKKPTPIFEENKTEETSELKNTLISSAKQFNANRNKRKRSHNRKNKKLKTDQQPAKTDNNIANRKFAKRRTTLLERLLENEIRHERNALLQCVRYVVSNNFFES